MPKKNKPPGAFHVIWTYVEHIVAARELLLWLSPKGIAALAASVVAVVATEIFVPLSLADVVVVAVLAGLAVLIAFGTWQHWRSRKSAKSPQTASARQQLTASAPPRSAAIRNQGLLVGNRIKIETDGDIDGIQNEEAGTVQDNRINIKARE